METAYEDGLLTLLMGDCHELLAGDQRYDCCITDPPYGNTNHEWDAAVGWAWLDGVDRTVRDGNLVCTAAGKFAHELACAKSQFRYSMVWVKNRAVGWLDAKSMPLRRHESVMVFGRPPYNPQMVKGPMHVVGRAGPNSLYGKKALPPGGQKRTDLYYPSTVLEFDVELSHNKRINGCQKPLALMEWLVATYTNPGDLVLDPFAGSCTTLLACRNLGRRCVGVELDPEQYGMAAERLRA